MSDDARGESPQSTRKVEKKRPRRGASAQPADLIKPLGSAAVVLAGLLGAGAVSGGLTLVARNQRFWLYAAVILGMLAACLWAVATELPSLDALRSPAAPNAGRGRRFYAALAVIVGALFCMLAAVGALAFGAIEGSGIQGHPSISASFVQQPSPSFKAKVEEGGLANSAILKIRVRALTAKDESNQAPGTLLFASGIGPNTSGNAVTSFSIPFQDNSYSEVLVIAWTGDTTPGCQGQIEAPRQTGCAAFLIPGA